MQLAWPTFTQGNIWPRRMNFLLVVCNYTNYKNWRKPFLPNPLAREKAGGIAGTICVCAYSPESMENVSVKVTVCTVNAKAQVRYVYKLSLMQLCIHTRAFAFIL